MHIEGDPLPGQWQVILHDDSVIDLWAGACTERDGYYVFDVLANASLEEQADPEMVITADNPTDPDRIMFVVARVPARLVKSIWTKRWDEPLEPQHFQSNL